MPKSNFKDDFGLRYGSKDAFERYKGRSLDYSGELKKMLDEEELDWENEEQRYYFLCRLYALIKNWKSQLPDLRQFFRNEQMDWLIAEDVKNKYDPNHANKGTPIINFVIKTGYKDNTEIDKDGKPILRRTTAIHLAAKNGYNLVAPLLFKIYDSFDANYVEEDESGGLTHFHAACAFGYEKIVEKFLELGQDPNCPLSDDSPLNLALKHEHKKVVEVLLRRGANPNSTSRSGQKSLQIAVANLAPDSVKLLLDHGADLSHFVFPAESQFNERLAAVTSKGHSMKLEMASLIMMIVEHLEKRGYAYAPNRSDVLTIVKLLSKHNWLNKFSIEYWLSNEDFVIKAKELKMKPSLSLYDFVRLPAEQATDLYPRIFENLIIIENTREFGNKTRGRFPIVLGRRALTDHSTRTIAYTVAIAPVTLRHVTYVYTHASIVANGSADAPYYTYHVSAYRQINSSEHTDRSLRRRSDLHNKYLSDLHRTPRLPLFPPPFQPTTSSTRPRVRRQIPKAYNTRREPNFLSLLSDIRQRRRGSSDDRTSRAERKAHA
ncbi:unnamed protein product [Trichogramma brassicae]|uniref:Uncharacterized protein n=1 Tax=Trichogramma brassicae TaxID=86971 RepID=A0A6H5J3K0_9HYME|nr:unnamed protein product [Trichogramma brassicae]